MDVGDGVGVGAAVGLGVGVTTVFVPLVEELEVELGRMADPEVLDAKVA